MLGCLILGLYLGGGVWLAERWLSDKPQLTRIWLGASIGLLLFFWLPALFAFFVRFDMLAQGLSLSVLAALCGLSFLKRGARRTWDDADRRMLRLWCWTVAPLTLFSLVLQYTHTLREVDGALHVGQSTYGDLCLHLSIATSLRGAAFPPEYALLPGTRLAYPFLTDALSTSLLLWGMRLNWALIVPSTVMMCLVYMGILLLAERMTKSLSCALWTFLLLVFCGGLGFLYDWDMVVAEPWKLREIFDGYYKTPANQPDFNLRWSNILADLWIPQRTFLGGWTLLLPALYLVLEMIDGENWRDTVLLSLFAGALPLVHTHSFMALGLFSAGCLGYCLIREPRRRRLVHHTCGYLAGALALALPQLIAFTFRQSSAEGFVRFQFNWVNNPQGRGLIDTYLFFWAKNVGLPFLLMLWALPNLPKAQRPYACGAFLIFGVAELVLFQPNEYDNNKLFYVWYLMMLPCVVQFGQRLYRRLAGVRGRTVCAAAFLIFSMLSGMLSVAQEAYSDHELIRAPHVALAQFVEEQTPRDAIFMTATHHNNAISALAGRAVVCGPGLYLRYHGLDYERAEAEVGLFYQDPAANMNILYDREVRYIVLSDFEEKQYDVSIEAFDALFTLIYNKDGVRLYEVE